MFAKDVWAMVSQWLGIVYGNEGGYFHTTEKLFFNHI